MVRLFFLFLLLLTREVLLIITTGKCLDCGSFLADRHRGLTNVLILHPQRHPIVDPEFTLCKARLIHASLNALRRLMNPWAQSAPFSLVSCREHTSGGSSNAPIFAQLCTSTSKIIMFFAPSLLGSSVTNHVYSTGGRNPGSSRSRQPKPMYGGICSTREEVCLFDCEGLQYDSDTRTPPPPLCNCPPLAISHPPPGDRHFHVFLANMYCAGLWCPSALHMALHCFPLTSNQSPVCIL